MSFKLGTIVETSEGLRGVVVGDMMNCCSEDETPVVFYGATGFEGTPTDMLREVGPENAVADLEKCGARQGAKCCRFLTVGAKGPRCERHSTLRYSLIFKEMNAKRHPVKAFPLCQDLSDDGDAG